MRVKPYLLASAMALSFSLSAIIHPVAFAADAASGVAPVVLAQNGDNRGFMDKLFNRRGDNSSAKPIYMDKGSSKTIPFNIGRNREYERNRRSSSGDVSWEAFEKRRRQHAMEIRASVQADSDQAVSIVKQKLAAQRAAEARELGAGGGSSGRDSTVKKRMVYDPDKAWTYSPNQRDNDTRSTPRLYNPSR